MIARAVNLAQRHTVAVAALLMVLIALPCLTNTAYVGIGDVFFGPYIPHNAVLTKSMPLWGTLISGLGSPQFNPLSVSLGIVSAPLLALRVPGPLVESLVLVALMVSQAAAIAFAVKAAFPERLSVALVAGLAFPLSLFNAENFLNPIQAWSVVVFAASIGLAFEVHKLGTWTRLTCLLLLSCCFVPLGSAAPIFAFVLASAAIAFMATSHRRKATDNAVLVGTFACFVTATNAWWIYGLYVTLCTSPATVHTSFAAPDSWSWVNARASFLNLITMTGAWSWPNPSYFPWATPYVSGVLRFFIFAPALLAAIAIVTHRVDRRVVATGAGLVALLFIAKGTHEPLASVNAILYKKVPFFWLLRDPQNVVGGALYVALYVLAALGLHAAIDMARRLRRPILPIVAAVLVISLFATSYAVLSRSFLPMLWLDGRARGIVSLPDYWASAAGKLDATEGSAKRIVVLPNDDYYQMPYTWGYYGADSLPQDLFRDPVLYIYPVSSGYVSTSDDLNAYLAELERSLSGDGLGFQRILGLLAVTDVVERRDIDIAFPDRRIVGPNSRMAEAPFGLGDHRRLGKLVLSRTISREPLISQYDSVPLWLSGSATDAAKYVAATGDTGPWIRGSGTAQQLRAPASHTRFALSVSTDDGTSSAALPSAATITIVPETAQLAVRREGETLVLELVGPVANTDTTRFAWRALSRIPARKYVPQILAIGSRYFEMPSDLQEGQSRELGSIAFAVDAIPQGKLFIGDRSHEADSARWSSLHDCFRYDSRMPAAAGLTLQWLGRATVRLEAAAHSACSVFPIAKNTTAAGALLRIRLAYRHISGAPAQIALLDGANVLYKAALGNAEKWSSAELFQRFEGHGVQLYAYADEGAKQTRTVNEYRVASSALLFNAGPVVFKPVSLPALGSGALRVTAVVRAHENLLSDPTFTHGLWNPLFDAYAVKQQSMQSAGIWGKAAAGVLTLSARENGAGEAQRIDHVAGRRLVFQFSARALKGSAPAAALLAGDGTVLWRSSLSASSSWQSARAVLDIPESSDSVTVYFYAYGSPLTTVQYRSISVSEAGAGTGRAFVTSLARPRAIATSSGDMAAPSLGVQVVPGAKLLVVRNSYHPGWIPTSHGVALNWRHVAVNGIYNGWIIEQPFVGPVILRFRYEAMYDALGVVAVGSFTTGLILAVILLLGRIAVRKRRQPAVFEGAV